MKSMSSIWNILYMSDYFAKISTANTGDYCFTNCGRKSCGINYCDSGKKSQ